MTPLSKLRQIAGVPHEEIAALIERARGAASADKLEETVGSPAFFEKLHAAARQDDPYAALKEILGQSAQTAERWHHTLRELVNQVETLEESRARRELYGSAWWERTRDDLRGAFLSDPQAALELWMRTIGEAIVAWKLDAAARVAGETFSVPSEAAAIVTLFRDGTVALRKESERFRSGSAPSGSSDDVTADAPGAAAGMLRFLLQRPGATTPHLLDQTSRALLNVCLGRLYLIASRQPDNARSEFEAARTAAPNDGRPYAALGDSYREAGDVAQAMQLYQHAIEQSLDQPEGYVGMGLSADAQSQWDEADAWYQRAIRTVAAESDLEFALSRLLAPVSGNLYLQLARGLKESDPEGALEALVKGIALGIARDGSNPERHAFLLKGQLLESLNRSAAAANAYFEAGRRFAWNNENDRAVELLTRARELEPTHVPTYWALMEALRMMSYLPQAPGGPRVLLERSLEVWQTGTILAWPSAEHSWAYISRALINENLARFRRAQAFELYWEAVAFAERAILLNDTDIYGWVYLARFHRYLLSVPSALQAVDKALTMDEANLTALEERAAILGNVGRFVEAEQAIDKRRQAEPNVWADAVKAFVLLYLDRPDEALTLLDGALKAEPANLWYRELRALALRKLGRAMDALDENRAIWEGRGDAGQTGDESNQTTLAWAAYRLGKFDEAIALYTPLLEDPIDGGSVHRNLGVVHLARGETSQARGLLLEGIKRAGNAREIRSLVDDLRDVEQDAGSRKDPEAVRAVLAETKPAIDARRAALETPRSAEEDLGEILAALDGRGEVTSWVWLGAKAGLARLLRERNAWPEAAVIYQRLQSEAQRFPEATLGLQKVVDALQINATTRQTQGAPLEAVELMRQALSIEPPYSQRMAALSLQLGDLLFTAEDAPGALKQYESALALSATLASRERGDLQARISLAHFAGGDLDRGRSHLEAALGLYGEWSLDRAGEALSKASLPLVRNVRHFWALAGQWKSVEDRFDAGDARRRQLGTARTSLLSYFQELHQLLPEDVSLRRLPVVKPIMVDLGAALIPEDTSSEWPLLKTYIPDMRARIQADMGVSVPGVHFRDGRDTLPPSTYRIFLDEVPVFHQSVPDDHIYCVASPEALKAAGVPEQDLVAASHPVSQEPGCWVARRHGENLAARGFEIWRDPLLHMVLLVEAVVRRQLASFLGIQELENLVALWSSTERGKALVTAVLPNAASRRLLLGVLRALLAERVPITRWEHILEAVRETGLPAHDLDGAIAGVRRGLRDQLPGNNQGATRVELPTELEDSLSERVRHEHGRTFFAVPLAQIGEVLEAVGALVDPAREDLVVVTRRSALRPFIRRLVPSEQVMGLSRDELLPAVEAPAASPLRNERGTEGASSHG